MIKTETRGDFVYTYSDEGYPIRQIETGIIYGEAYDTYPCRFTYEETSEKAETSEEEVANSEETKENV